ncbi:MAG TPA: PSD1 and planctomycete cytochrome C domain-containing protein [Pirellulales bacterium]|jgi:hypothetical protein|nr:PSD1 and planctomycete cytochrome C domain-containing protein [Pirellulales bacterium]
MSKGRGASLLIIVALGSTLFVAGFCARASSAEPESPQPAVAKEPAAPPTANAGGAEALEFFERKVRPLLAQRCLECHSGDHAKGSLHLDSRAGVFAGGDTGPAVVPGKPGESLLVDAVNYGETYQMPPKSKLAADEVAVLTRWVEIGAPWPEEAATAKVSRSKFDQAERRAAHWAWQPIQQPDPPAVVDDSWPRAPFDRFVLARLEQAGLHPAAAAERPALVRRLYFDLIGLPPSSEELATALADESPDAVEHLVDRLLASPHFGERWGRHWLDLVRYCESRGHEYDVTVANAWQYRDYVIRAMNADVPYDQFVTEHLAGDLVSPPRLHPSEGFNESILGTGFWLFEEAVHSPVDIRQDETDRIDQRLDVLSKAFLGLTVACARCHDHKFDAISQRDYYALAGFAVSASYRQVRFETLERERQIAQRLDRLRSDGGRDLRRQAAAVLRPTVDHLADYLSAAGEILWPAVPAGSEVAGPRPPVAASPAAVATLAAARGVDERQLGAWADQLTQAYALNSHPLHRLALSAAGAESGVATGPPAASAPPQVIVDYADPAAPWYADGFAFGLHPVRSGDVLPAADPAAPLRLSTFVAARRDPAWLGLKNAADCENDFDRLGQWDRSGQTLRTPEVMLESGKLWYLVRGPGRAYAVVNSHMLVHGPLHGQTLLEWKAKSDAAKPDAAGPDAAGSDGGDSDAWHWVGHDLSLYAGHRAHVEFSPVGGESLTIAKVIDSPERPALDEHGPDATGGLPAGENAVAANLAAVCQETFKRAVASMAERQTAGQAMQPGDAALADWLLARLDLLAPLDGATGEVGAAREQLVASTAAFRAAEAELAGQVPRVSHLAPALLEGNGADEPLLIRGNSRTPGDVVGRRPLEAFAGSADFQAGPGSGRLELARSLIAADNPLVARVMVNRVWHHLFGTGIVPTVDNFGLLGQPPSHPELLDYLARQFMADDWSLKRLIRRVVLSRTYQMSSYPDAVADERDPGDVLLHRMRLRRLEGEAIRDAILAVSGGLDRRLFGPSVPIYLTADLQGRGRPASSGPLDGGGRRSLYLAMRRNFLSPMLLVFDLPNPATTVGRRNVSNVPAQALILLNDPFVDEQALAWARRALAVDLPPAERISRLYLGAIGRPPEPRELEAAMEFLHGQAAELGRPDAWQTDERTWADLAHVLWNSKEFLFVR